MIIQQAILMTENNLSVITETLIDYTDPQHLYNDFGYLFCKPDSVHVLVKNVMDNGMAVLSHVVTESMFFANATTMEPLNDKTFVEVRQL